MPSTQPMDYNFNSYLDGDDLNINVFLDQIPSCQPLGPSGLADHYDLGPFITQGDIDAGWETGPYKTSDFYSPDQDYPLSSDPDAPTNGILPQPSQSTFSTETQETLPTPRPTPRPGSGSFAGVQDEEKPKVKIITDRNKTRAETQIQLDVILDPLSPRYDRVRFPKKTIAKPKYYANEQEKADFEKDGKTLSMELFLVLATAVENPEQRELAFKRARGDLLVHKRPPNIPLADLDKTDPGHPQNGGEVIICQGCKEREDKRYNRKKKRSIEDEREWDQYKNDRAIIINEKEYKNLKDIPHEPSPDHQFSPLAKMISLHMRIACYCRHQEEKSPLGYRVIFTFKDSHGKVVTQHMSEIFQITDDHKNKDFVHDYSWSSVSAPPLTSVSRPGPFPKPASRIPPPFDVTK